MEFEDKRWKEIQREKEAQELVNSHNTIGRINLAINPNTSTDVLNILVKDPVENVSYKANLHPMCTDKREFSSEYFAKCVLCDDNHVENVARCNKCKKPSKVKNPDFTNRF